MHPRRVAVIGVALGIAAAGCYDVPKPACGFRCGAEGACPPRYACASDGYCHAEGTPASLTCPLVDAGIDAFDFWPFIQTLSPDDGAKAISVDTNVTVKFTEQVVGISAETFTLVVAGETTPVPATVTYDLPTRTATLDPAARLRWNTPYVAALGDGIADARGNPIYGQRSWSFTTKRDDEGPTLVAITPAPGATNVPGETLLTLELSEQVQFPPAGFVLASASGGGPISPSAYPTPSTLVFALHGLAPETLYTFTISPLVVDLAGNAFVNAPVATTFTTAADTIPPTVTSLSPQAGAVDVSTTAIVTAQFDEPVVNVSSTSVTLSAGMALVPATVIYDPPTRVAQLTPAMPLAPATVYTVRLTSAIQDAQGNLLAPLAWSFTTVPPP